MKSPDNEALIKDVIEWDIENWFGVLSHWSPWLSELDKNTAKILCLGERNGGLSLWFALQGFRVICSDFGGPKEVAHLMHKRYGVAHLVEYSDLNIFELPYSENAFDVVACKSVIGGLKLDRKDKNTRTLANQKLAVEEVRRILKPGGLYLGAENMRGTILHSGARKLLKGDKIGWRHFQVSEVHALFENFGDTRFKFFGFLGSYYKYRLLNIVTSNIDSMLSTLLPKGWQYIVFIVARK